MLSSTQCQREQTSHFGIDLKRPKKLKGERIQGEKEDFCSQSIKKSSKGGETTFQWFQGLTRSGHIWSDWGAIEGGIGGTSGEVHQ